LAKVDDFREEIYEANVKVHQFEAKCYELIHVEIYGRYEQKRINSTLKRIDKLIAGNWKKALDFGAGTGNITGKLLRMGHTVTAVDISPDICAVLNEHPTGHDRIGRVFQKENFTLIQRINYHLNRSLGFQSNILFIQAPMQTRLRSLDRKKVMGCIISLYRTAVPLQAHCLGKNSFSAAFRGDLRR
jgi:SAM-dependent methyltransferase